MQLENWIEKEIILNGEKMFLIDVTKALGKNLYDVTFANDVIPEWLSNLIGDIAHISIAYGEFKVAVCFKEIGENRTKIIMAYTLMEAKGELFRVWFINLKCQFCGWEGQIADPRTPSLYDFLKNSSDLLKHVLGSLPKKPCPKCEKFPDFSFYPVFYLEKDVLRKV